MNDPEIFAAVAAVKDAYRSLEEPNFAFVERAARQQGYSRLLTKLESRFSLQETTDTNDDVAFTFLVSSDAANLGLWLSMVAPYALIQRVEESHVETLREPLSEDELSLVAELSAQHVTLVSERLLRHRIHMRLPESESGMVTLYQALFDNSQALPWGEQVWGDDC